MTKTNFILIGLWATLGLYAQNHISSDVLKAHVSYLANDSLRGRGWGTEQGLEAAHYIADRFADYGVEPWEGTFLHYFENRSGVTVIKGQNVIGVVRGTEPGYIVIGAHYDHIAYKKVRRKTAVDSLGRDSLVVYNGADDNASGVATILALGQQLASQSKSLGRSVILVAFDAEESGLIGSHRIIKDSVIPLQEVNMMFSVDMMGHYKETESLTFKGLDTFVGGKDLIAPIAEEHGIKLVKTKDGVESRTDTHYFGLEGVPSLYVSTGIVGPYHKPEDVVDTIDFVGMEKMAKFLLDVTQAVSNAPQLEPKKSFSNWAKHSGVKRFQFGVKAAFGSGQLFYLDNNNISKTGINAEVGFVGQWRLADFLLLRPELLYTTHGSAYVDGNLRFHSATVPLSLLLATPMKSGFRAYALGGAYYAYAFAGTLDGQAIDLDAEYNSENYGLSYGFGFQYNAITFNYEVRQGLNAITPSPNRSHSMSSHFSMSYFF